MKIKNVIDSDHFKAWTSYHGKLHEDTSDDYPTTVFGYDSDCEAMSIPSEGAVFGFVFSGRLIVDGKPVNKGEYFVTKNGGLLSSNVATKAVLIQRIGFIGLPQVGGEVEDKGRLKYIDKCSDTLLIAPPMKGDPCLNHLHFPEGIDQTAHTHPSIRVGMVYRGRGHCTTPHSKAELKEGMLFIIPRDGNHKFDTVGSDRMDVIAYHPDTDFGPENEVHPMINRTIVGDDKIDNSKGVHTEAEVQPSYLPKK